MVKVCGFLSGITMIYTVSESSRHEIKMYFIGFRTHYELDLNSQF